MLLLDAIRKVLQESKDSLHYQEITYEILDKKLWDTEGLTPENTVSAMLSIDAKKGDKSEFVKVKRGYYAIRKTSQETSIPDEEDEGKYTFADATEAYLNTLTEQEPLSYKVIAEEIQKQGLVATSGETPHLTLHTAISREIKRLNPRFTFENGKIGLISWNNSKSDSSQKNRESILKNLKEVKPYPFEKLVALLFRQMGFEKAQETKQSGDGGIDVRGSRLVDDIVELKVAIQVKKHADNNNIHRPAVQQLRGSLKPDEQGIFVTSSKFSSGAQDEAKRKDAPLITLIDGEKLAKLLVEFKIDVKEDGTFAVRE